jgi:DNA repair exonuclease SbcCD nuclease subunit
MIIAFADPHIEESNIEELDKVFNEIFDHSSVDAHIICLGDFYHKNRPTAKEIEFGTKWASRLKNNNQFFTMLRGNHTMVNFKDNDSSVEYLKYFGISILEELVIDNIYFGHKMTEKSDMFFGIDIPTEARYEIKTSELLKYNISLLGHQHAYQEIDEAIYHIGSIIYTTFNEVNVSKKYIFKIDEKDKKIEKIELKTPYPMVEISSVNELDKYEYNTKIRLVFKTFEDFKNNISKATQYKNRFIVFKIKCDFDKTIQIIDEKQSSKEDIILKWINSIKDKDVREELIKEFGDNK